MNDILWNKNGTPLLAYGKRAVFRTTGVPSVNAKQQSVSTPKPDPDETTSIGETQIVNWGSGNTFPTDAEATISKTGVLNTGLRFTRNFILGQGVYAVNINGYDDDGNEQITVVNNPEVNAFLRSRMIRRYMEKALRDVLKFGMAFPQLIPNSDGSKIVGINTINALRGRLAKAKNGVIENVVISGDFPENPQTNNFQTIPMLDDYDPFFDLDSRRILNQVGGKSFIFPLYDSWSNNDYYPLPIWYSAKLAGWVDIAQEVPKFLKKAYQNQITWMWHIQIPYAYWDKKYPRDVYNDEAARMAAIQAEMDKVEETLTGAENANKAIFTMFEVGAMGKAEEQWTIDRLENETKDADKLFTSAAANSEILFALMLNPNVMGAGMPGGTYAGNQGGSNIREAYLVNIANSWLDQQNILDPIELMLRYNGVKDVELRFRKTVLTTLDTGAGTKKVMS
jgi:hypothetical protein